MGRGGDEVRGRVVFRNSSPSVVLNTPRAAASCSSKPSAEPGILLWSLDGDFQPSSGTDVAELEDGPGHNLGVGEQGGSVPSGPKIDLRAMMREKRRHIKGARGSAGSTTPQSVAPLSSALTLRIFAVAIHKVEGPLHLKVHRCVVTPVTHPRLSSDCMFRV